MKSSAQEVTMLFKLIVAAKDSWACFLNMLKNSLRSSYKKRVYLPVDPCQAVFLFCQKKAGIYG